MKPENKKLMDLQKVLKSKVKRAKEKKKDLEVLIDGGTATSRHKQEYVEVKAQIEAWEDIIDLIEGMTDE
ncbi:hypothetical protein [Chryseobacterium gambrini]|uniref:Uncharacterized protein n=2 Tax=Chryseobacterium TaxID=59732 RepID=A0A1N7LF19_9FLAO|nr:hypothetical protein [Chryseobacterium gambrini]SIS72419.1 hypothetical protein SAMN05421785_102192 [Chryseobacterium gambrini]